MRETSTDIVLLIVAILTLGFLTTGDTYYILPMLFLMVVYGIMVLFTPKIPKKVEKPVDYVPHETYLTRSDVLIEVGLNYGTSDGFETGEIIEDYSKGHIFRFYSRNLGRHYDEYGNQWGGGNIRSQLPGTFPNQEKKMNAQVTLVYREVEFGDETNPLLEVFEEGDWVPRWNENNIRSLQRQAIPDSMLAFQSDKIYRVPVVINPEGK